MRWWIPGAGLAVAIGVACTTSTGAGTAAEPAAQQEERAPESEEAAGAGSEAVGDGEGSGFERPRPPAMEERVEERERMVRQQIASGVGGRTPVTDEATLRAMREVPRHAFIPARMRPRAYEDTPLPIGEGQTISQPYIVAYMTQLLGIDETSRVLEIGTGSGYQAAVLAHITPHVWTIEIVEPLAERARRDFAAQGYDGIEVRTGDGYLGWPEAAPFDAIIVTAAAPELPQPLWEQLAPGGRIVMPRGPHGGVQELVVIHKGEDGEQREESLFPVRFVPFTRAPEPEE